MKLGTGALALAIVAMIWTGPVHAERRETITGPVEVTRMVGGLDTPWAIGFLPDGSYLITERGGRLVLVRDGRSQTVSGTPRVQARGQGGLLDVVVARDFERSREIFLTFSEPRRGGAVTAMAVGRLDVDTARLTDVRPLFRQDGAVEKSHHFGSRVVEAPDGSLFVTIGDRGERNAAQDPTNHQGKVVQVLRNADGGPGSVRIWSSGHRNPQGAALGLDGALWTVEHGAQGGDEVNLTLQGRNYGWPVISYGLEYSGGKIGSGTARDGMEQPQFYWDPSIAPSGMMIYSGKLWPEWRGNVFIGSLKFDFISRLSGDRNGLREAERLFEDQYRRIRDVREAPDGSIWFLAENEGEAWRITPANGS